MTWGEGSGGVYNGGGVWYDEGERLRVENRMTLQELMMDLYKAKFEMLVKQEHECAEWLTYWTERQETLKALRNKFNEDMQTLMAEDNAK